VTRSPTTSRSSRVILLLAAALVVAASVLAGPAVSARQATHDRSTATAAAPSVNGHGVTDHWTRVNSFKGHVVDPASPAPTTTMPTADQPARSASNLSQTMTITVSVAEPYCRSEVAVFNQLAAATPEAVWPSADVPHEADADDLCELTD